MRIPENLAVVKDRIKSSAVKAGRNPQDIKLVAVTKTVGVPEISEAIKAGISIFGESRVQEAQKKIKSRELRVTSEGIEWHLIGHLQVNKARQAVELFDMIHSVDSVSLAEEISTHAGKANKTQRVLVQVKLSDEESKHGVPESGLMEFLEQVNNMKHLILEGLMTIPPFFEDPEKARLYFRRLRESRDRAMAKGVNVPELSLGMSHDLEQAQPAGA